MRTFLQAMFLTTGLGLAASAGIIVTAEAAGVQSTTRTGVIVETFDSLTAGPLGAYSSIIGDYSSGAQIVNPNAFGGSGQTKYISVGAQSAPSTMYTLDFGKHITYFGLYWAAGDRLNILEFFDGATKVGSFTTSDWAPALSKAYSGNPNTGQNTNEKYAFLNFDATAGTKFNMVKFLNNPTSTGFETDNHTILAAPEVPEPSTWAMMIGAAAALGFARKRKLV